MNWKTVRRLKILDFDIENRPLHYWCPDRPSADITAIAWSWVGPGEYYEKVYCYLLGEVDQYEMLQRFYVQYAAADIVTGHYIRRHDIPVVNGALIELGMPTLGRKMVSDTKCDLIKRSDLPTSQEALAAYFKLEEPKIHMGPHEWREANRLTEAGLALTRRRVTSDIRQHKAMREEMIKRGLLKSPRIWEP